MKTRSLLLFFPVLCLGCLQTPKTVAKPQADAFTVQKPRTLPPVTPEQISERNARPKLQALQDELDRATQEAYEKPQEQQQPQLTKAK